jgi:hypothetical protein
MVSVVPRSSAQPQFNPVVAELVARLEAQIDNMQKRLAPEQGERHHA